MAHGHDTLIGHHPPHHHAELSHGVIGAMHQDCQMLAWDVGQQGLIELLPATMKLDQCNVFTSVCDSVNRGSASVHAGIPPRTRPPGRRPPRTRPPRTIHPQDQTPPRTGHPLPPGTDPPWEQYLVLQYLVHQAYNHILHLALFDFFLESLLGIGLLYASLFTHLGEGESGLIQGVAPGVSLRGVSIVHFHHSQDYCRVPRRHGSQHSNAQNKH